MYGKYVVLISLFTFMRRSPCRWLLGGAGGQRLAVLRGGDRLKPDLEKWKKGLRNSVGSDTLAAGKQYWPLIPHLTRESLLPSTVSCCTWRQGFSNSPDLQHRHFTQEARMMVTEPCTALLAPHPCTLYLTATCN